MIKNWDEEIRKQKLELETEITEKEMEEKEKKRQRLEVQKLRRVVERRTLIEEWEKTSNLKRSRR